MFVWLSLLFLSQLTSGAKAYPSYLWGEGRVHRTQVPWFISSTQSCQWVALSTRRGARPTSQVRTPSCACWVWPGIGSSTPVTWVQLKQWGMTGCKQLIRDCCKNKQSQTNHWIAWSQCLSVLIYFSVCDGGVGGGASFPSSFVSNLTSLNPACRHIFSINTGSKGSGSHCK